MGDERLRRLERAAALGDGEAQAALARLQGRLADAGVEFGPWVELVGRSDPTAPVELSSVALVALERELAGLGPLRAAPALSFVRDGGEAWILDHLVAEPRAAEQLSLKLGDYPGHLRDRDLRASTLHLPPPALLRLALLFQAALAPRAQGSEVAPAWLAVLLWESSSVVPGVWSSERPRTALRFAQVEATCEFAGEPLPERLLRAWLFDDHRLGEALAGMSDAGARLTADYAELLRLALREGHADARCGRISLLERINAPLEGLWPELAACGVARAARLRQAAQPLLRRDWEAARPEVERFLSSRTAAERAHALELLAAECSPDDPRLERLLQVRLADRAKQVRRAAVAGLERLEARTLEPVFAADPAAPLPPAGLAARAAFAQAFADAEVPPAELEAAWTRLTQPTPWAALPEPPPALFAALMADVRRLLPWLAAEGVRLAHAFRAAYLVRYEHAGRWRGLAEDYALAQLEARGEEPCLQAAARALHFAGQPPETVGRWGLEPQVAVARPFSAQRWRSGPYYAEQPGLVVDALTTGLGAAVGSWSVSLLAELREVLGLLDPLPEALGPCLLRVGLTSGKRARALAQDVLDARGAEVDDDLIAALDERRGATREAAARWLGRRGAAHARPDLERRLGREKTKSVRRALEDALALLG